MRYRKEASITKRSRAGLSCETDISAHFLRCLEHAKAIVRGMQTFNTDTLPCLYQYDSTNECQDTTAFCTMVLSHVDMTFTKFSKLFKILMVALSKMERDHDINRDHIHGFRTQVLAQWRLATQAKDHLVATMQKTIHHQLYSQLFSPSSVPLPMPSFMTPTQPDQPSNTHLDFI